MVVHENTVFDLELEETKVDDSMDTHENTLPKLHFCEKLEIYLPYRAKYCNECEAVVAKFDHHCFWLGGCVGELNHGKFWIMVASMTLHFSIAFYYVRIRYFAILTLDSDYLGLDWSRLHRGDGKSKEVDLTSELEKFVST
jgi:DHHC palmitoyltransferase